jgi:selenocysteine lyase/cysteine desulfurase
MREMPPSWFDEKSDDFWEKIRSDYKLKPNYVNLENGYYSMMAQPVMEAYIKDLRTINLEASYYLRTIQYEEKNKTRDMLAELTGCLPEEMIITRNTTESLDTVISGIEWKDYGSMLDMFKQQARRFGIVNKTVELPLNPKTDDEIVDLYASALTSKTKLLMVCHMVNITGQILPVRKICDMAHARGVEVLVDGAHAVAHFDFKISELNCDYYGSSLHKWLGAPLGAGILYVKKDKVAKLWPLFGESGFPENDIRKLNHTGTISAASDLSIRHAIDYHNAIGVKRKEERLRFLKNYWTEKVRGVANIYMNTPDDIKRSCGIANVGISGMDPNSLAKILMDKYSIWTVGINTANVHGVRITPHLYTTTEELDRLVNALVEIAKK